MSIVIMAIIVVLNILLMAYFIHDWRSDNKRKQLRKNTDVAVENLTKIRNGIDELEASLSRFCSTVENIPGQNSKNTDDSVILDESFQPIPDIQPYDVEFAHDIEEPTPDAPSAFEALESAIIFKNDCPDSLIKDYMKMYLNRPKDMFRTMDGHCVIIRRNYNHILRRLVEISGEPDLTVNGCIDNIIRSHLTLYKREIETMLSTGEDSDLISDAYDRN